MNTTCEVARDLMPLVLDDAASSQSSDYLKEHLAQCETCRAYYQQMQSSLSPQDADGVDKEQQAFQQAANALRWERRKRRMLRILLGLLIGVAVSIVAYIGWTELAVQYHAEIPFTDYAISLSQLQNGDVVLTLDTKDSKRVMGGMIRETPNTEDGYLDTLNTLHIWMETTLLPRYTATARPKGPIIVLHHIESYESLNTGKHHGNILWQAGDSIPAASPEMEAYYAADDARWAQQINWSTKINRGEIDGLTVSGAQQLVAMDAALETLRQAVPEWQ